MITTATTVIIALQLGTIFTSYAIMLTELYSGFSSSK
jgi:hypothetical protein